MAQNIEVNIPIVCENDECKNCGSLINIISEINIQDVDLFYENYDGSNEHDYCPICGQLGIAEDPVLKPFLSD
ncbi:MAG: hypothetical protein LC099_10495 [Anaerolineales bacterium]|nr:hypothetical protein [Anaerolineales bacterium]